MRISDWSSDVCSSDICDMDLRLLPDGPVVRISVDRGAEARGCRLDAGAVEQSVLWVAGTLESAELLVVNKFGKQEAEGKGLSGTIAEALDHGPRTDEPRDGKAVVRTCRYRWS